MLGALACQPVGALACLLGMSRLERRRDASAQPPPASDANATLEQTFRAHFRRLVALVVLLIDDPALAEDIAQDAFIRSAAALERIAPEDSWPYLRRAAINICKNRWRRLAVERRIRPRLWMSDQSVEAHDPGPRDELWAAIVGLPRRQRECLVLRFYEDLSERDTATILGCSPGAVKTHTSRGLARLRKEISNDPT
jgi:RNA polymerase sigma-70 factor (sigma-E family)